MAETPIPKDAPVEPDFARLAQEYMERIRWPNWQDYCGYVADAMEEAFAAGRQAAPQPGGDTETPQAIKIANHFLDSQYIDPDGEECVLSRQFLRAIERIAKRDQSIAALEAALRGMVDMYVRLVESGDCGFWNPGNTAEVKAARAALTPTSGAASGKGEGG